MQNNLHAFDHGGLAADVYSLETENSGVYVYEICFRAAQSLALLEWEAMNHLQKASARLASCR